MQKGMERSIEEIQCNRNEHYTEENIDPAERLPGNELLGPIDEQGKPGKV